jgi:hypothetical protein
MAVERCLDCEKLLTDRARLVEALRKSIEAQVDGKSGSQWRKNASRQIQIRAYMTRYLLDAGIEITLVDELLAVKKRATKRKDIIKPPSMSMADPNGAEAWEADRKAGMLDYKGED